MSVNCCCCVSESDSRFFRRVIYVNEGKGKQAVQAIGEHLQAKGAQAEQIQQVSMDLSPAFIAGVKDAFPCAQITFDRFHIVKLLNQAMDAVRKAECKEHDALRGHQYTFLKKTSVALRNTTATIN